MKRIECMIWEKKKTPSGYWDNGLYELTKNKIIFPEKILEECIIFEITIKINIGWSSKVEKKKAYRVTYQGSSWVVDKNPLNEL